MPDLWKRLSHGWRVTLLSGAALIAIWIGAVAVMQWASWMQPTPESVTRVLEETTLKALPESERLAFVERVGRQIRRLDFEQRRRLRRLSDRPREFFLAMSDAERERYLELTRPAGFEQMMQALNGMEKSQREKFVKKAVSDLREAEERFAEESDDARQLDEAEVKRIVHQGMKSYFSDASASTKIDLQPLVEQMQRMRRRFE